MWCGTIVEDKLSDADLHAEINVLTLSKNDVLASRSKKVIISGNYCSLGIIVVRHKIRCASVYNYAPLCIVCRQEHPDRALGVANATYPDLCL